MSKSAKNKKGTSAHRKVRSSTVKNRKSVKCPSKIKKQGAKIIVRDAAETQPVRELKEKKQIKILPIETVEETQQTQAQQTQTTAQAAAQRPEEQAQQQQTQQIQAAQDEKQAQKQQTQQKQVAQAPDLSRVHERMRARTENVANQVEKISARELKEQEIKKALNRANKIKPQDSRETQKTPRFHFGVGRVVLALSCAAAAVFAIVYFVNLSAPDLSLRVAAMQTGIEASYPSYVPRDFSLSDITSENGKITMNFVNHSTGDAFSLTEEKSSWDSNALLENFVRKEYGEDYATVRENGLTLYIKNSNAAWVNGGMVFKLTTTSGSLTKKQIRAIAVSL